MDRRSVPMIEKPASYTQEQDGPLVGMPHLAHCQVYLTSPFVALMMAAMPTEHEPRLLNRLRVARAERDLSQERLARAAGVSRQTISSIESGQYCPSTLLAFRLARVLGVRVDELFWLKGDDR